MAPLSGSLWKPPPFSAVTVVRHVERHIVDEGLEPGDRLPTERDLAAATGVSRAVVRAALADLADRGVVLRAIVLANLTLAYIRQRKLDEAIPVLYAAIDIVERHRGGGGLNLVFQAGRELKPWRDAPEVYDVHDRLMNLMLAG